MKPCLNTNLALRKLETVFGTVTSELAICCKNTYLGSEFVIILYSLTICADKRIHVPLRTLGFNGLRSDQSTVIR